VIDDVREALALLRPIFVDSGGSDGFASIEVAPELAHDTHGTVAAARNLNAQIDEPNLLVKIPATAEGVPAIKAMIAEGRSINVTLIFSLSRYRQVLEAYRSGLEYYADSGGDVGAVHSVASFFVSRVDTEVDRRLEEVGTAEALSLRGRAAIAQAKLAYQLFRDQLSDERWTDLEARGAHLQRPLWASTSTKNAEYPDTLYVDNLIGPNTVNTLPETTIAAFEDHGTIACTINQDVDGATEVLDMLASVGVDMEEVGRTLEDKGVTSFHESFAHVLDTLNTQALQISRR